MIDFNAMNSEDGTFKASTLAAADGPGRQGGHMLVLEDYVVDNVPGVGRIDEGDVSDEMKQLALTGDLAYLVTKNSWSDKVTEGYHRFYIDYLDGQLGWKGADATDDDPRLSYYTTLSGFILPPGY